MQIKKVTVRTYGGKLISIETSTARRVLQAQVLKGLCAYLPGNTTIPSLINAPYLASELGIETAIDKKVHQSLVNSPYSNIITVDVELEGGRKRTISGSVFGTEGNIVQIDNYKSFPAFQPEGTLLTFRNEDRPGAVSDVLRILSDASINVARMNVGRQEGELALCLMDLDAVPAPAVVEQLKGLGSLSDVFLANVA
eukprot:TRINITY_DN3830_c0_g1_i2.p1 TRINITY_DN3830_c0_g1~~TRINITY_DN3830_c0_g1_i2.p1  ORF type:complete len:197 (-),score=72.12 TRINITY_DN3830_c0_g1_i2:451-1041(-)